MPFPNEVALKSSHAILTVSVCCNSTFSWKKIALGTVQAALFSCRYWMSCDRLHRARLVIYVFPWKHCSLEKAFNPLAAKSHYIAFDAKAIKVSYCFKLTISQCCKGAWTSSGRRHQCFWTIFRAPAFHFQPTWIIHSLLESIYLGFLLQLRQPRCDPQHA